MENRDWAQCGSLNVLPSSVRAASEQRQSSVSFQGVLESGVVPEASTVFTFAKTTLSWRPPSSFPSANRDQSPFNFESTGRQKASHAGSSKASVNAWGGKAQPWKIAFCTPHTRTHKSCEWFKGFKCVNSRCRLLSCKVVEVIKHESMQLSGTSAQCHLPSSSISGTTWWWPPGNHILALASFDEALNCVRG